MQGVNISASLCINKAYLFATLRREYIPVLQIRILIRSHDDAVSGISPLFYL